MQINKPQIKNLSTSLKVLTNELAVSGYEWELGITNRIQALIGKKGKRIADNLVYSCGNGKKKIMIIAHMDEVGFFITQTKKDYCRVVPVGDISASVLSGKRLIFMNQSGLMYSRPIVQASSFDKIKVAGLSEKINVGDVGTFEKSFQVQNDFVFAPSLDNKVGCLVLIEVYKILAKEMSDQATFYFCFASREEVGLNGVMAAARMINPDLCIDVDSAYAKPIQNTRNWSIPVSGKGVALQLMGTNFVIRSENRRFVEDICNQAGIPIQYEIPEGSSGGTNSSSLVSAGYDSIQINIPVANQHSAKSKVSLVDISQTIMLLTKMLRDEKFL